MQYTLVLGLDAKHLQQLRWVWPTWQRHKPSVCRQPIVAFYDHEQICVNDIKDVIGNCFTGVPWPPPGVVYRGGTSKWDNPQRMKMLSGFIHVVAKYVETDYWLKLDTDVVATDGPDEWVDTSWFHYQPFDNGSTIEPKQPAIVAQHWHYTKPPTQMMQLDGWVAMNHSVLEDFHGTRPVNLPPQPGMNKVKHPRICSWCAFFRTDFTCKCAEYSILTQPYGHMPVASQDGFQWYCAARLGLPLVRTNMRRYGWDFKSTMSNVRQLAEGAMV